MAYRLEKINIHIALTRKGDLKECSYYRTIALSSHATKFLLRILLKRTESKLETEVKNTQAGSRCIRSTRDHIFNLIILLQKCRDASTELRMCFIDYSNAFDWAKNIDLWNGLLEFGFNKAVTLIRNLYVGQEESVRLDAELSGLFKVNNGVRQVCILSPYLFNLYTEDIMRNVEDDLAAGELHKPKVNRVGMGKFKCTGDQALLSMSQEGLENVIGVVRKHNDDKELHFNVEHTKIMDSSVCKRPTDITAVGKVIERVDSFKYLGSLIDNRADATSEIKR